MRARSVLFLPASNTRAVEKALRPDGLSVMQFNGAAGGQTVFHLHFHIIPRYDRAADAGLHIDWRTGKLDPAAGADLARQIAAAVTAR